MWWFMGWQCVRCSLLHPDILHSREWRHRPKWKGVLFTPTCVAAAHIFLSKLCSRSCVYRSFVCEIAKYLVQVSNYVHELIDLKTPEVLACVWSFDISSTCRNGMSQEKNLKIWWREVLWYLMGRRMQKSLQLSWTRILWVGRRTLDHFSCELNMLDHDRSLICLPQCWPYGFGSRNSLLQ